MVWLDEIARNSSIALLAILIPTVVIGYSVVIPASPIARPSRAVRAGDDE